MITHLRVQDWRAYESAKLEFKRGTTFVVAANGVGKTSLIYALGWGVFGDLSGISAKSCIRAGARRSVVEVTLRLTDGREVVLERTVAMTGNVRLKATVDGSPVKEDVLTGILEDDFGVRLDIAARLCLMLGGGHAGSTEELDLQSHLYQAFGLSNLVAAAEVAEGLAKAAKKQRERLRSTSRERLANREETETALARLRRQAEELASTQAESERRLAELEHHRRAALEISEYQKRLEGYQREVDAALARTREQLKWLNPEDFNSRDRALSALAEALAEIEEQTATLRREQGRASGLAADASEALRLLESAEGCCPTCMRPIDVSGLQVSRDRQRAREHEEQTRAKSLEREEAKILAQGKTIGALRGHIQGLREPRKPAGVGNVRPLEELNVEYRREREMLDDHLRTFGQINELVRNTASLLTDDDQVAAIHGEMRRAYRREALTFATAKSLKQAMSGISGSLVRPVADEVRARWERLFSAEGLTLKPDGKVVRVVGDTELGWDSLSGGERIWARVITHLLVLASFTRLPFAWFDEPLEHLDPSLRRAVAATLATTTSAGRPTQLLVTTYENTLAQQLSEDIQEASLLRIRSGKSERRHRPLPTIEPSSGQRERAVS